jgi:two-component system CheB/CheR fusion protein
VSDAAPETPADPSPDGDGGDGTADDYQTPPFLVAAVGASAGGLEAFSTLVHGIPADAPLALMLVQHMARDQHSLLPEILGKRSALTVIEGRADMPIEPGHVYIISAGTHMTAIDGRLRVLPRPPGSGTSQIDTMFRSLAHYYRDKSVGVVLSGGAADGTAGLREIKAAGGITIAQLPEEARIDSMPRSAIAAGVVDVVLPVEQIAAELVRLAQLPLFKGPGAAPAWQHADAELPQPEGDQELRSVMALLRRAGGVDFSQYKRPTISRRVARRMALRRLEKLGDYVNLLQQDPAEVENLCEDILIHVTSFFRDPQSFSALAESVFPSLIKQRDAESGLRLWVPGCSTGEEVYSLAISLFEVLGDELHSLPVQVFGTDVSERSVNKARAGLYSEQIAADVGPERLRRFFTRVDDGYRIAKLVRERCVFARQDVTRDPPFSRLDLILCRNMLIYLNQPTQLKVIGVLHYALKSSGLLMLGRAETTGASAELFSVVDKRFRIYQKKAGALLANIDFSGATLNVVTPPLTRRPYPLTAPRAWDVQGEANRLLLDRFAPPGIVLDSEFQITRVRGRTSAFLELPSGDVSLDALKMVRESLHSALQSGLQEARASKAAVRKEGLDASDGGDGSATTIDITPFGDPDDPHYLVLFEAERSTRPEPAVQSNAVAGKKRDEMLEQLRRDLAGTREQLRAKIDDLAAANEELQSANEEILSSNEELQSTNEELDTAKEELQSTNEELSTLNEELHCRNEELTRANADLGNLLASAQIPIVMVTSDLRIRRFTPAAENVLNLIPSDVGRPINHINPNISCPELDSLISDVIASGVAREQEVQDRDGRPYSLRIRPYKSVEDRIDGAVLALVDIPTLRDLISVAEETGEAIMSSVPEPILLLAANLEVLRANPAFYREFSASAPDVEGKLVYHVQGGRWDNLELRRLIERVLPERENFENFPLEFSVSEHEKRRYLLDARRVGTGKAQGGVILLLMRRELDHAE